MKSILKTYAGPSKSSDRQATSAMTEPVLVSELRRHRQFLFSAMGDDIYKKFGLLAIDFEQLLNNNVDLRDYTDAIRKIRIIPLIFTQENSLHEEYIHFNKKTKEVILQPLIEPAQLTEATMETYPALLADTVYEKGQRLAVLPEPLLLRMRELISSVKPA